MKRIVMMMLAFVLAGCGGTETPAGKEGVKSAAASAPAKPAETVVKRPVAGTQPRLGGDVPMVFAAREPDGAKASIAGDSAQARVAEEIMENRIAPRKSAVPFTRNAIPDPDDRANMPSVGAAAETMPAIPSAK